MEILVENQTSNADSKSTVCALEVICVVNNICGIVNCGLNGVCAVANCVVY